jgi:hypothetical protein
MESMLHNNENNEDYFNSTNGQERGLKAHGGDWKLAEYI